MLPFDKSDHFLSSREGPELGTQVETWTRWQALLAWTRGSRGRDRHRSSKWHEVSASSPTGSALRQEDAVPGPEARPNLGSKKGSPRMRRQSSDLKGDEGETVGGGGREQHIPGDNKDSSLRTVREQDLLWMGLPLSCTSK